MEDKPIVDVTNLDQRLRELEEENRRLKEKAIRYYEQREQTITPPQSPYTIEQDIKTYNNIKKITLEDTVKEVEEAKTYGEYKEEARLEELQKRNSFMCESFVGTSFNLYKPEEKARHFQEIAFLNLYESSEDSFKELVSEKMELLKDCKYWDLLEQDIEEDRIMDQFFKSLGERNNQRYSESKTKLGDLAKNIMIKINHREF